MRTSEDETTVVLISDGKETCNADPCKLVKSLRQSGIRVQIHVVGFDVDKEEKKELLCIAEEGGGKYFSAGNANELNEALVTVKEEVEVERWIGHWRTKAINSVINRTTDYGITFSSKEGSDLFGEYYHCNKRFCKDNQIVAGIIQGRVEGNTFNGVWERTDKYARDSAKGDIQLILSKDGKIFHGIYSQGSWSGKKE